MFPVCPPPWHFTTWLDLLDHWRTLAAAFLAVVAAAGTIWATTKSATRQFVSTQKQIETSFRLDQRRVGREDLAFHAILEAALSHVLDEATEAEERFPGPGPYQDPICMRGLTRLERALVRGHSLSCEVRA
jgi:hypothetical protein